MANTVQQAEQQYAHYPDLAGKVALVTGGSRGIGAAICRRLAANGAKVAVNGRDAAAIESVVSALRAGGAQAIAAPADITNFDAIESMRRQIEQALGPVEILVANAGGSSTRPGPIELIDEAGWRASVEGNLTATFLTIKSFLPGMKERKAGCIITMSSAAARRPHPGSPIPYAAAKAGIQILTQDVAAQAGPFGIRVNCLAPETILTERNEVQIPAATKQSLVENHPIRRLGMPDDVANAAAFLASTSSGWITGTVLDVAGGAVMV